MSVSSETGVGLQDLLSAIEETLRKSQGQITPDIPLLTSARHRQAVATARSELLQFERAWREEKLPPTVASVHLRAAVAALEELVGSIDVEDIFDRVFSSFCVGK